MDMYSIKKIYKRILICPKANFFLFGVRGSGKTSLLKQKFPKALYIDLLNESIYQSYLANVKLFYQRVEAFKGRLVIIDEIQRMPNLLNEIHRLIELSSSPKRFILTGSSARKIRAKGVNLLAGRAGWINMHPFTPEELGKDFNLDTALKVGLLPVVWSSSDRSFALKAYTQMYLKEEIKAEGLTRNLPGFARFLPVAGLYHAQIINMNAIARESQISRDSVRGFFSILEDTLLGFFLPAYSAKIRLREQKHPKFYLIDPGIARSLKQNFGSVSKEEQGSLFEGLIAQLLRAYKDYRNLCDSISYWAPAEARKTEVDFILERGKKELIAVEVKSSSHVSSSDYKGLKAIACLKQVRRRIVVYAGDDNRKTEDGIEIWPFHYFCKMLKQGSL